MIFNNIFNEICKLSSLNATKALSQVIQIPIGVSMSVIELDHINEVSNLNAPDEMIVNVALPITGNVSGLSYLLYSQESAFGICDILLNRTKKETQEFTETEISALAEVANIVIGNFLTSFAQSLQIEMLIHRTGTFECSPFKDIYQKIKEKIDKGFKKSLLKIVFNFQHSKIKGQVIIFLEAEKINAIWQKLFSTSDV